MNPLTHALIAACNLDNTWITSQIKCGRKLGLVGKDLPLLIDIIQNQREYMFKQSLSVWLVVMDEEIYHDGRILKLLWPENLPRLNSIDNTLWTWAWYNSPGLTNLKVWLYQYKSDGKEIYPNSLQRGIVYSNQDTDEALTDTDQTINSAKTLYISLDSDQPTLREVTMPRLSNHSPMHCLTLNCHSDWTATSSVRLPIRL